MQQSALPARNPCEHGNRVSDSVGIFAGGRSNQPAVLGTEGDGLAADTIEACDYTVRIPRAQGVDSLNVAAASAVAFWQLGTVRDRGIL